MRETFKLRLDVLEHALCLHGGAFVLESATCATRSGQQFDGDLILEVDDFAVVKVSWRHADSDEAHADIDTAGATAWITAGQTTMSLDTAEGRTDASRLISCIAWAAKCLPGQESLIDVKLHDLTLHVHLPAARSMCVDEFEWFECFPSDLCWSGGEDPLGPWKEPEEDGEEPVLHIDIIDAIGQDKLQQFILSPARDARVVAASGAELPLLNYGALSALSARAGGCGTIRVLVDGDDMPAAELSLLTCLCPAVPDAIRESAEELALAVLKIALHPELQLASQSAKSAEGFGRWLKIVNGLDRSLTTFSFLATFGRRIVAAGIADLPAVSAAMHDLRCVFKEDASTEWARYDFGSDDALLFVAEVFADSVGHLRAVLLWRASMDSDGPSLPRPEESLSYLRDLADASDASAIASKRRKMTDGSSAGQAAAVDRLIKDAVGGLAPHDLVRVWYDLQHGSGEDVDANDD